ncbi:MAG: DUF6067 family protein [Verrucomicrobia bacterium]|nr:DUF6067 family protein [Verrucomicrobiota bacterium]
MVGHQHAADLDLEVAGLLEFDGLVRMRCNLLARKPISIKDIRLEGAFTQAASAYLRSWCWLV